jgi:hypothetical protein
VRRPLTTFLRLAATAGIVAFLLWPIDLMLVLFTINGIGVREAFFVAFLGRRHVDASAAVTAGFLFFALTAVASLPGAFVLLGFRGAGPRFLRRRRKPNC